MAANPNNPPRHYFTLEEYFALENVGDARYEYWDGDIVCMSGGSESHYRISGNIYHELRNRLDRGRCTAFTAETPVKTPSLPPYRYPDVSVTCGEAEFENIQGTDVLLNPVLVVEVLSPSSEQRDAGEKFAAYKSVRGFAEYLLVEQDHPLVTHYSLQANGFWVRQPETSGLSGELVLTSVECTLSMVDIYEGVTFANIN
ncbi:MAG TPA: Uma2 family endonuclease [Blastocatellia bacterium]